MGIVRKLWNVTPAVIIGKKIHQAAVNKKQQKAQQPKPSKTYSLSGTYYSSHPEIHGCNSLMLELSNEGVVAYDTWNHRKNKKVAVREFRWSEVIGYENETEDKTQLQTSQRVTATRMLTVGVFALAAPKKSTNGNVKSKFYDVLHTTTGDIVLDAEIDSGNSSGSIGELSRSMAGMMIRRREASTNSIKRFVAEHATGKAPASVNSQADDPTEQVRKLAQLKDEGLLTEQEFERKKKELLGL